MSESLPPHSALLLVEDDDDVREAVAQVLRSAGREVFTATDGLDALQQLEQMPRPCLILLDLRMPRMDGLQFLDRLKARSDAEQFPVLVLSATQELATAEYYPGVLGTLKKPFKLDELLKVVSEHC